MANYAIKLLVHKESYNLRKYKNETLANPIYFLLKYVFPILIIVKNLHN